MEKLLFLLMGVVCIIAGIANAVGVVPGMSPSPAISVTFCAAGGISLVFAFS